jgi:hypothetical protein
MTIPASGSAAAFRTFEASEVIPASQRGNPIRRVRATNAIAWGLLGAAAVANFVLPTGLQVSTATASGGPATIRITGVVRDFRATHPDMAVIPTNGWGHYAGNVDLLFAAGRPTLAPGGFRVTGQWRERQGFPIAPHLYSEANGMAVHPLAGYSGVGTRGIIKVTNGGVINSAPGTPLVVSSNKTGVPEVILVDKVGSMIDGDVLVGVGGDPATEIVESAGGVITGSTGTMPPPSRCPRSRSRTSARASATCCTSTATC